MTVSREIPILPSPGRAGPWAVTAAAVLGPVLLVVVIAWQGPVVALVGSAAVAAVALVTRRPSIALALPLLAAPVALRDLPRAQGAQVIHVLLVAVIAVVALSALRRRLPPPPVATLGGALFVAVLLFTTLTSVDPFRSLKVSVNHTLGLLMCLAAAMVARHSHAWLREVLRLWTVASLVVILPNLPAAAAGSARFGGSIVTDRAQGVFAQPNDFGEFSLYCLGVAWALLVAAERRPDRVLAVAGLLGGVAGLALSYSRGSWIGAAGLVVVACALAPTLLRVVVPVGVVGATVAVVATALSIPPFSLLAARFSTLTGGVPNPEDDRAVIYAEAVRIWLRHPVIGQGPGTFANVAQDPDAVLVRRPYLHAHSVPLDIAAEAGTLGVLALAVVTAAAAYTVVRGLAALRGAARSVTMPEELRAIRRHRLTLAVLAALLGGVAAHGAIDVVYTNPYLIPMAWSVLGLVLGAGARAVAGRHRRPLDAERPEPGTRAAEPVTVGA